MGPIEQQREEHEHRQGAALAQLYMEWGVVTGWGDENSASGPSLEEFIARIVRAMEDPEGILVGQGTPPDRRLPPTGATPNDLAVALTRLAEAQIDGLGDVSGAEGRAAMRAILDELDRQE